MEIAGLEAMRQEAARFAASLSPRADSATVVALAGELGAGKTSFVQGMAAALGVEESVTSPTFVIEKVYELADQKFARLIHIDAYRLKDAHELETIGWDEISTDPGNIILIEWPERIPELLPADAARITFSGSGEARDVIYG